MDFIPRRYRKGVNKLGRNVNQALRNYVNGALLDSSVVFVISTIVFAILGLKSPLLFGLFCGLMNVIPYVGPYTFTKSDLDVLHDHIKEIAHDYN